MAKANREKLPRVNFFDGQRITEADLDDEQIHHRGSVSNLIRDFHGSGIVRDRLFESRILLDTSDPGSYLDDDDDENKYPQYLDNKFDNLNTAIDRRNIISNNN